MGWCHSILFVFSFHFRIGNPYYCKVTWYWDMKLWVLSVFSYPYIIYIYIQLFSISFRFNDKLVQTVSSLVPKKLYKPTNLQHLMCLFACFIGFVFQVINHGKSPLNHHLGKDLWIFPSILSINLDVQSLIEFIWIDFSTKNLNDKNRQSYWSPPFP